MNNQTRLQVLKNLFYGLILVMAASTVVVFAHAEEPVPIVNSPDLPVCDIETLGEV